MNTARPFFCPIGLKFFMVTQEKKFWRKNGRGHHVSTKGPGPQDPTKKLAQRVDLLGQPLSRKPVFKNFGPELPLYKLREFIPFS